jgi:16S rRNA (uracil1498-N3)-methyltransferase
MQLFYHPTLSENSLECTFDAIESQHIVKVLRKKESDILMITNGNGFLFESEIILAHDKRCKIKINSVTFHPRIRNYYLQIAIAPTKNMDRMEWFVEKATEIGVDEIVPIFCEHSERKIIKTDRLEKVAVSAMKQSGQFFLTNIAKPVNFKEFINQKFEGQRFIAHCEKTERQSFKHAVNPQTRIQILIGPEGDFSTKEIEMATKNNIKSVIFGKNRLRTETAGIVAVHTVALINEV